MSTNSNELLEKVLRPGSSFYYSTLHLADNDKHTLAVIFTLFQEWLSLHDNNREPQIAHTTLHWWLEQLNQFSDETIVKQSSHPLLQQLSFLNESPELKRLISDKMQQILLALVQDQHFHTDERSLENFLSQTWGNLCVICGLCVSEQGDNYIKIQHQTGLLLGYHNLLKNLAKQLTTQRCALPQSWFEQSNITQTQLIAALQAKSENLEILPPSASRPSPKTLLLNTIIQTLKQHQMTLESLPGNPQKIKLSCLPALKALTFESALLHLSITRGFEIFDYRLQLSPLKKLWLGWRCKRYVKAHRIGKIFYPIGSG